MRSAAGQRLGLALVVVLLASVVGLSASQAFINKTGKTVSGITITFSKDVRITRHDSVFRDQAPSGRSDEFTFDGGDLRNSGRFTVSWMPSSGKVTDYEWIEKAQTVQATQAASSSDEQEFKLPDPNTPPILYGNDYPGPDEPLYQPEPDEQIWLTDLDGHEAIYDNDSIKINYAPGFDKSQITKIDVYRNGVKLRFVPEKFDVLTNAQMKTFDGNPAEHSPASNHTDHAIMGYEYEFKISTADHLWILKKTVKSGFRWHPKEIWAFLDISWHWSELYGIPYASIVKFFEYLKHDGFTGISFDMIYYVMMPTDSDVFEQYTADHSITNWEIVTPTTAELEKMLKAAEAAKMEVQVRGHLYISQKYQDEHGFRCSSFIDPASPQEFFDSYTKLWLKLVPLLNKYRVKLITPFTEMEGIERYPDLIKAMYIKISEQYSGEMGFEEATNVILTGNSVINDIPIHTESAFKQLVRGFTFWDWKDSQGRPMRIEYSCWNPPVETQKDQRVSVMTPNFVKFWSIPVDYYRSMYPQDPQMFGEIGACNADGQSLGAAYWDLKNKVMDEQEIADFWYAALKGSRELSIDDIDVWSISLMDRLPLRIGNSRMWTGYGNATTPCYQIIKAIIGPTTSVSE